MTSNLLEFQVLEALDGSESWISSCSMGVPGVPGVPGVRFSCGYPILEDALWSGCMEERSGTLSYADGGGCLNESYKAPCLILVMVVNRMELGSCRFSLGEVDAVEIGRGEKLVARRSDDGSGPTLHIEVPDGWMSSRHLRIERGQSAWRMRDSGSKNGCYRNGGRCDTASLADGDVLGTGNTTFLYRSAVERTCLDAMDSDSLALRSLPIAAKTLNLSLVRMMTDMSRVAVSPVSVIIGGETGTGKEVCARYVHQCSARKGAFVAVNCGALPENLVESELFGHRKGAFSGATSDRVGLVQASDGGTLFLDEVAELPLAAQVKLLRCLQEREVVPVGATWPVAVNLRVVAATHADLPGQVASGCFRADLYARLAGVSFKLPPLRDRREDVGLLVSSILRSCSDPETFRLERDALWALCLYPWPRNIRELEQALVAATAWANRGVITLGDLPDVVSAMLCPSESGEEEALKVSLIAALREQSGNISATAREMGKARVQIRRWCKKFGIDPVVFK